MKRKRSTRRCLRKMSLILLMITLIGMVISCESTPPPPSFESEHNFEVPEKVEKLEFNEDEGDGDLVEVELYTLRNANLFYDAYQQTYSFTKDLIEDYSELLSNYETVYSIAEQEIKKNRTLLITTGVLSATTATAITIIIVQALTK